MNAAVLKVREMPAHPLCNEALGDRAALDRIWADSGYWFFKDVLDRASVAEAKRACVEGLIKLGFVAEGSDEPVWNGKNLDEFPDSVSSVLTKDIWRRLVAHPRNKAFFESVLGGPLLWLPMDFFRLRVPHAGELPDDPAEGRHQDGYGTQGLPFVTCWIPLMEIDATVGGLTVAEGVHKRGIIQASNTVPYIPAGVIPLESWRYTAYAPGDVVMFDQKAPHSGLNNYSNMFRLSMDLRVMREGQASPIIGVVKHIDETSVVIDSDSGGEVSLTLGEDSYCCLRGDVPLSRPDAIRLLGPGKPVLALEREGHVVLLRPQTNFERAGR